MTVIEKTDQLMRSYPGSYFTIQSQMPFLRLLRANIKISHFHDFVHDPNYPTA